MSTKKQPVVGVPRAMPFTMVPSDFKAYAKKRKVSKRKWSEWEYSIWVDLSEESDSKNLADVINATGKPATFAVEKSFRMLEDLPSTSVDGDGWATAHAFSTLVEASKERMDDLLRQLNAGSGPGSSSRGR